MRLRSLVILVVDPDPTLANTLAEMLKSKGHVVCASTEKSAALRLMDTVIFNAAILPIDLHQSEIDMRLVQAARAKRRDIKIVGISGSIDKPTATLTLALDSFINTPFSIAELEDALLSAVAAA